jgi:hypothetical protein
MKVVPIKLDGVEYNVLLTDYESYSKQSDYPFEWVVMVTIKLGWTNGVEIYSERYQFYKRNPAQYFVKDFSKTQAKQIIKRALAHKG